MHISLRPEIIGTLFGISISNSLILSLITASLLLGGGFLAVRSLRMIPGRAQNVIETLLEAILTFMGQALGNKEQTKKFFPLVATIFLFILFNNWVGVLPGTGSVGFFEPPSPEVFDPEVSDRRATASQGEAVFVPFFRSANSDLNTTLALALISVAAIQWYGIRKLGFLRHISKFLVFTKGPIQFFVGILELIGEFARVLSFSFRLFGNIFAGEVLLLIIMTLVPVIAPLPFIMLEFFVGFIQALVFAMLTLIFLKIATETVEH